MNFFWISRQIPENSDVCRFFNQICENKSEICRKFWILWKLFTIIQNYSLHSLLGVAHHAEVVVEELLEVDDVAVVVGLGLRLVDAGGRLELLPLEGLGRLAGEGAWKEVRCGGVESGPTSFRRSFLGCIEASDSESRRIFSDFSRSTRFSHLRTATKSKFAYFFKISHNFNDFSNFYKILMKI